MRLATYWYTYQQQYMAVLLSLCLLLCAVAFSGIAFWYAKAPHAPSGDEPHYLIISQTLVKYHSLNVMQDYRNGDYHAFYPQNIDPHVIPAATGRLMPIHGIGGPVLWALPFALAGWLGAVLFMSAVTVLIVWNIYLLLCELDIEPPIALLVSMAFALASPLTLYAHLVFIEPIAALLCLYATRKVVQEVAWYDHLLFSFCLGILPWIHIRFALLEIVLFFAYLYKLYRLHKLRDITALLVYLLPVAALFVAFEVYNLHFWGTLNPAVNQITMDNRPFTGSLPKGLVGMLFDQEYGLIVNFPIFFLLLAGIVLACSRKRYAFYNIVVLLLTIPYLVETASLQDWAGGWCPPARFILVLLPLYAFYLAYVLQQRRNWLALLLFFIGSSYGILYNRLALLHSFNGKKGMNLTLLPLTWGKYALVNYLPSLYRAHMTRVLVIWIAAFLLLSLILCLLPIRYTKISFTSQ